MNVVISRKTDEVCTKGKPYSIHCMYDNMVEFWVKEKPVLIDRNDPDFSVLLNCNQEEVDLITATITSG